MSEVNADGVLLNPQEELKKEVNHRGGDPLPGCPYPGDDVIERTVRGKNGKKAGQVGGSPHAPVPEPQENKNRSSQ